MARFPSRKRKAPGSFMEYQVRPLPFLGDSDPGVTWSGPGPEAEAQAQARAKGEGGG